MHASNLPKERAGSAADCNRPCLAHAWHIQSSAVPSDTPVKATMPMAAPTTAHTPVLRPLPKKSDLMLKAIGARAARRVSPSGGRVEFAARKVCECDVGAALDPHIGQAYLNPSILLRNPKSCQVVQGFHLRAPSPCLCGCLCMEHFASFWTLPLWVGGCVRA